MATRRNVISSEKRIIDSADTPASPSVIKGKSELSPAVPTSVIMKLLAFTAAMIILPLGSYFLTLNTIFKGHTERGNSTLAGATAAIVANLVLIGYVVVAMKEDQEDNKKKQ